MANFVAAARARNLALANGISAEAAIDQAVDEIVETGIESAQAESQIRQNLTDSLLGYGALQPLLDDSSIEEIWINSPSAVFVARAGVTQNVSLQLSPGELQHIIERMLRNSGRRLDRSNPFVDASLENGSRLHVVIPEITKSDWAVNIRKFPERIYSFADLVTMGSLSAEQATYLQHAVDQRKNILVSGATQAGKTTMLCALLEAMPKTARIISVEETFEIRVSDRDWVALQTRQPNLEGVGEVTLRRLVKEALRMRPDRLVVGEVREAESLDLLIALNSGLPGACTIHANSARDAIAKLCTLPLLAGQNISSAFVNPTVGNCIDVVAHCELSQSGQRRLVELAEVRWNGQQIEVQNALV